MPKLTAIYDSCVLYPSTLRSFLMYLAVTDLYAAKWTADIHSEWIRNVQKDRPNTSLAKLERARDLMNANVRDCLVTGYEPRIDRLTLPDPDDRHVLAAAIEADADIIVTFNVKDFPEADLQPFGVEAQHPDDFLADMFALNSAVVCGAARTHRASLRNPPMTADEYLSSLERQRLPGFVSLLRTFANLI